MSIDPSRMGAAGAGNRIVPPTPATASVPAALPPQLVPSNIGDRLSQPSVGEPLPVVVWVERLAG